MPTSNAAPSAADTPPPDVPVLQITQLRYRWPGQDQDTLDLAALSLQRGQTMFLRGPSGCGKSTLLALAAGVLLPQSGSVALLGQPWSSLGPSARDRARADHLGVVFQQFNLLPYLSMLDNVRLPLRFSRRRAQAAGPSPAQADRAAEALLGQFGLPKPLWHQPAARLSVGQQQRVAAARALIGAPALLIADEPTSALDEPLRDAFMDLLLARCAEAGTALLFVSHDARLAPRFDQVLDLPTLNRAAQPVAA